MIMGSTRSHGGLTSSPRARRRYLARCHARTEAEGCQIFRILKTAHTFLLYMNSPNSEILAPMKCDTEPARVLNTTTEATWPGRPRCDFWMPHAPDLPEFRSPLRQPHEAQGHQGIHSWSERTDLPDHETLAALCHAALGRLAPWK